MFYPSPRLLSDPHLTISIFGVTSRAPVSGLPPLAEGGSHAQPAASHSSDQQRKRLASFPLPLTEAGQNIPHMEEGKSRELLSAEPAETPEEAGVAAGGELGEDPHCPALPAHQGSLLLSAGQLAGQSDGGQRGERSQQLLLLRSGVRQHSQEPQVQTASVKTLCQSGSVKQFFSSFLSLFVFSL